MYDCFQDSGDARKLGDGDKLKCQILSDVLDELALNNEDIERVVSRARLEENHPVLAQLSDKYGPSGPKASVDRSRLFSKVKENLKERIQIAVEVLTGSDDIASLDVMEMCKLMSTEMASLKEDLVEVEEQDEKIKNLSSQLLELNPQYRDAVTKLFSEYKIPFKVPYDDVQANFLCARTKALLLKNRLVETEEMVNKYGDEKIIQKQRETRSALERESAALDAEFKALKREEAKYDSLDSTLVDEYKRALEDLEMKRWASEKTAENQYSHVKDDVDDSVFNCS
ncbi:hypothetical protein HDE_08046 [Halotydeus destructor]|nr:hypothetical protein HDE_08046 [Halotydeus destructor]